MTYSVEIIKNVLQRVINGENVEEVSKDMGISVSLIHSWLNYENDPNNEHSFKKVSNKIKKLIEMGKISEAKEMCAQFKDYAVIQSQLVKILINEGKTGEAKEICERFSDYPVIQSQLVTILINEGKTRKAKEICEKFKEHIPLQSQLVRILVNEGKIDEAKKICESFKDHAPLQSQLVTILMSEGKIDEAKKICEKFKEYAPLQSQLIVILIEEGNLEQAKEMCAKPIGNAEMRKKLMAVLEKQAKLRDELNDENKVKTIGQVFAKEILQIMGKLEKKSKLEKNADNSYAEDLRKLALVSKKDSNDLRAKMQLLTYLLKYGMSDVAQKQLKAENEIYQEIYRMVLFARDNTDFSRNKLLRSRMVKDIKHQIMMSGGNAEYATELLDKAVSRAVGAPEL